MKIKKGQEENWNKFVEINSNDFYSAGVVNFAKTWAELMEEKIESGKALKDIADGCANKADEGIGITGFMYGCAVSALAQRWEYGEELRKWHNHEYDYEGDGVVNPAILSIG